VEVEREIASFHRLRSLMHFRGTAVYPVREELRPTGGARHSRTDPNRYQTAPGIGGARGVEVREVGHASGAGLAPQPLPSAFRRGHRSRAAAAPRRSLLCHPAQRAEVDSSSPRAAKWATQGSCGDLANGVRAMARPGTVRPLVRRLERI